MAIQDNPLSNTQMEILRVASHHDEISLSRLAASPSTMGVLVQHGYIKQIKIVYSEPYYCITDAGRAALKG